jgi:hypothetical protein
MKWPVVVAIVVAMFAAVGLVRGDEPLDVDVAEVLRLGDTVQHVDGIRQDANDAFIQAMATPPDDSGKWFVSVLTMQNCAPCERLKADWRSSQHLLALADPDNPKRSWAHYQIYPREDKSQAFRFEGIKVTGYPTVIVQPPRNGKYGDPTDVVYQGGYGGDPEKLARQITDAVRRYVTRVQASADPASTAFRDRDPPWSPAPKFDDPVPPGPVVFPDGLPLIPPPSPSMGVAGLSTVVIVLVTSLVTIALVIGLPLAVGSVRKWREERDRRAVLGEALLNRLSVLEQSLLAESESSTAAAPKPSAKASAG